MIGLIGNKKLLAFSVASEISSISVLFFTPDFTGKIIAVLIPHLLASITLSQILWALLPQKYKKPYPLSLIALFVIIFATPVVSYISLIIMYFVLKYQKEKIAYPFEYVSIWKSLEEFKVPKRKFGEAAIRELVYNKNLPPEARLKAFMFLSEVITPETVQLLKIGLSDTNDEIRLLCFTELSKIEKNISELIHKNKKILEKARSNLDYLDGLERLTEAYWEAFYLSIGDEEINNFYLNQAYKYALRAVEFANENNLHLDPHIKLILGKVQLVKGDYEEAERLLKEVLETNIPKFEVVPNLAKLYYEKRNYREIKTLFKKYPYLRYDYTIYPIYELWVNG